MIPLTTDPGGVRLKLKVVPGASRDRVVGPLGDALKVAVSQPPEGGAANRAVVSLLARAFAVPVAQIRVVKGLSSPRKEVRVEGLSADEVTSRLGAHLRSR